MHRSARVFWGVLVSASAMFAGTAAPALGQAAGPDGGCTLLTTQEVESALGATGLQAQGSGTFCSFSGDQSLFIAVQPGQSLDAQRDEMSDGVETEIAGHPALSSEQGRSLAVDVSGQLLGLSQYGDLAWETALPALTGLAELAIPRMPAGPAPEDIARLTGFLPTQIAGGPVTAQTIPGSLLLGFMDATAAPVIALNDALAAQGKTAADILLVGVETDSTDDDYSVVAVWVGGADASKLVEPLFRAFVAEGSDVTFSTIRVGDRDALRIDRAEQTPVVVATSGDVMLAATVPEAELESVMARLP